VNIATSHSTAHLSTDQLNAWLDGETTDAEASIILPHLTSCERCQRELESLREVQTLLADMPEVRLPRSFALTVEQAEERPAAETTAVPAALLHLVPVTRILGIAAVIAFLVLGVASTLGPIAPSPGSANDAAAPVLSATGTKPDGEASLNAASPGRSAAPAAVDQGVSGTRSMALVPRNAEPMPVTRGADLSPMRIAWIASGAIATISLAAWAALMRVGPERRDRIS